MATLTKAQVSAQRELDRRTNGEFGFKNSGEGAAMLMATVPNKYAMLQLKRIGYGEKVIEACGEELAERLNVERKFDDASVKEIAGELFQQRFRRPADSYLRVRNTFGNNKQLQDDLDSMLQDDAVYETPAHITEEAKRFSNRKALDVSDPRVQSGDPRVNAVHHQGLVYHKVHDNTAYPDAQVEGVRIQAAQPITDEQMQEMATLISYESSAVLHATGTMSVPFRDSPNSFIMRSVPKVQYQEDGSYEVKQQLAPRSAGKVKNFAETLPISMDIGSSYISKKTGQRTHQGIEGGKPDGFSVFLSLTPKKL